MAAQWEVVGGESTGGLLCRQGRDLKSVELRRLARGSVVEQLELAGDRLHFKLLSGDGPPMGWISVRVKGRDVAVRRAAAAAPEAPLYDLVAEPCAPEHLDLGPCAPPEERPYGIVVYGATGFSGQLAVQHLDALLGKDGATKHKWAVAGRSAERLEAVRKLCKTEVDVIVATTEEEVHAMVGKCRVIISAVGPHSRWGEPVIRACVAFGTHYADIAGETWWLKRMITRYDAEARRRGVALVIMCAQQATVADTAANMLVRKLGPLRQLRGYVLQLAFTTGGTDANGRFTMEVLTRQPEIFADTRDPFAIGGLRRGEARDVDQDCSSVEKDPLFPKFWLGPLGCAQQDARAIRRSCELFEEGRAGRELRYGDDLAVVFREPSTSKPAAERLMQQFGPLPSAELAKPALEGMQAAVLTGQSPPPGQGPPLKAREMFHVDYVVVAEGESGDWATCRYHGGDPYEVTSMCAAVGALTLLEEAEAVRPQECGGFLTPAYAFAGTSFLERLQRDPWARRQRSASAKWEVQDGKATQEEIMALWVGRTKGYAALTPSLQNGTVKQWALPDYSSV